MKRKGFTLIELLAVIVILAVITIIAVPKILDVIESARRSAFESSVKLIEDSIKKQISINKVIKNNNIIIKNVYADESTTFTQDVNGYLFDFTAKNSNYTKLRVNNKEKFIGQILYRNDKKFIYTEFSDRRYILNTEEDGSKIITGGRSKKYEVIFMNGINEYEKIKVEENTKITLPEEDPSKNGYIFKYWSLTKNGEEYDINTRISEDTTLYAVYEVIPYTITFKNYDGEILQSEEYEIGEIPEYKGETPTKEATNEIEYTFSGWDSVIEAVIEEKEYIAQYTESARKYTITFKNENGSILQSSDIEYGSTPTYSGETPTKESTDEYTYEFKGWNKTISSVTKEEEYTAEYTATKRSYTVTYKNEGSTHETQTVEYGNKATKPTTDPTKANYTFKYWSASASGSEYNFDTKVTENLTLHAVYQSDPTKCPSNNVTVGSGIVCKRATTLHAEICSQTGEVACVLRGYTTSGSKGTNQIVYGNCGTRGTLTSGDAFDCDVTGRGDWQRFYYVTSKPTTSTNDTAVLIYYSNVLNGVADNTLASLIAYDTVHNTTGYGDNWYGPETAYTNLPSTTQWSNNKIIAPGTRQITYGNGNTSTTIDGTTYTIQPFTYTNKAARLLTYQELEEAGKNKNGNFRNLIYLYENTNFANVNVKIGSNMWLETPHSEGFYVKSVNYNARVHLFSKNSASVRPVIEVLKSDMSY